MIDQKANLSPNDPVGEALAALAGRIPPDSCPSPDVIEQTLARLAAAQVTIKPKFSWGSLIMKPTFQLSAAAVIAIALLVPVWLGNSRAGNAAFGQALAKVADVHTVSYRIDMHGQDRIDYIETTIATGPTRMRSVIQPQGLVSIANFDAGKLMMLDPRTKTATVIALSGMPSMPAVGMENILEEFKKYDSQDFERLDETTLNGHKTAVFRRKNLPTSQGQLQVWIDEQSQLPVQEELTTPAASGPDKTMTFSNIQWDVPVTDDIFSLTPLADYKTENVKADGSPLTEKDLIVSLQTLAKVHDGIFPDTFDMKAMRSAAIQIVTKMHAAGAAQADQPTSRPATTADQDEALADECTKITRGIFFAGSPLNGSDWHYAGKGIAQGAAATPILWYLPRGAKMYRVIDADLTVTDVAADQLPTVPSVTLNPQGAR
jgi:outer membrane lipoprotein-sorting protein